MDDASIALIISSCLLFVSELLPFLPVRPKGIIQGALTIATDVVEDLRAAKKTEPSPK